MLKVKSSSKLNFGIQLNFFGFRFRFDIPRIHGHYVGTGDVFACLLLVWLDNTFYDIEVSVRNVLMSLQALLKKTAERAYGNAH
jgi:pyridoxal/pyridoxine/pyridoxamine kinase